MKLKKIIPVFFLIVFLGGTILAADSGSKRRLLFSAEFHGCIFPFGDPALGAGGNVELFMSKVLSVGLGFQTMREINVEYVDKASYIEPIITFHPFPNWKKVDLFAGAGLMMEIRDDDTGNLFRLFAGARYNFNKNLGIYLKPYIMIDDGKYSTHTEVNIGGALGITFRIF